ncbi:MAG TPA: CPBP family glutamic-type intramembrane protease [Candidatus Saccharimonadales bacterium]|nr:CPBP family glutamic-type intramembrane protease [Candidatus Saccharimonadales bacterium]
MSLVLRFELTFSWDRHSWLPLRVKSSLKTIRPDSRAKKSKVAGRLTVGKQLAAILVLMAAIVAAQVTSIRKPELAVYIDPVVFLSFAIASLLNSRLRKLLLAIAIIPFVDFVTIITASIHGFNQIIVFYEAILVTGLIVWSHFRVDNPKSEKLHIKIDWNRLALFASALIVVGEGLSALGYLMLPHSSPLLAIPFWRAMADTLLFAVGEVLLFQGLIQHQADKLVSPVVAFTLTTSLFVAMHTGNQALSANLVFAALSGAVLSISYSLRKNLITTGFLNIVVKCVYLSILATFVAH